MNETTSCSWVRRLCITAALSSAVGVLVLRVGRSELLVVSVTAGLLSINWRSRSFADRLAAEVARRCRSPWTAINVRTDPLEITVGSRIRVDLYEREIRGRIDLSGDDVRLAREIAGTMDVLARSDHRGVSWHVAIRHGVPRVVMALPVGVPAPGNWVRLTDSSGPFETLFEERLLLERSSHLRGNNQLVRVARVECVGALDAMSLSSVEGVIASSTLRVVASNRAPATAGRMAHRRLAESELIVRLGFRRRADAEARRERLERIERDVAKGASLGRVVHRVLVSASSPHELDQRCNDLARAATQLGATLRWATSEHRRALRESLPGASVPRTNHPVTSAEIRASRVMLADAATGLESEALGRVLGGASFAFDPFDAYRAGLVGSPNVMVAGSIGSGKSTLVKMLAARGVLRGARAVVIDPKGEYAPLAHALGGEVVSLTTRPEQWLSPFTGECTHDTTVVATLMAIALERSLSDDERYAIDSAMSELAHSDRHRPVRALAERWSTQLGSRRVSPLRALAIVAQRLVEGDLAGLADSSAPVVASSNVLVCDLSAVWSSDRFALAAAVATIAARSRLDDPDVPGYLVIDEAWAVLGDDATSKWLQGSWKLARSRATSHVVVLHRWSDTFAAAGEGTASRARVTGLLRDCDTAFLFRQDHQELGVLREVIGVNDAEANRLTSLRRGRALVRFGPHRSLLAVEPRPDELELVDTDAAMRVA